MRRRSRSGDWIGRVWFWAFLLGLPSLALVDSIWPDTWAANAAYVGSIIIVLPLGLVMVPMLCCAFMLVAVSVQIVLLGRPTETQSEKVAAWAMLAGVGAVLLFFVWPFVSSAT